MKAIDEKLTNFTIKVIFCLAIVLFQLFQGFFVYKQYQFNIDQIAINKAMMHEINALRIQNEEILKSKEIANYKFNIQSPELKAPRHPSDINSQSNLSNKLTYITENDMNRIIDYWDKYCGGTPFKNKGSIFIEASQESGLDPVYLLAHAAWESGWGKSYIAVDKHNYYGISAYDHNPYNSAYTMGNSVESGIISGAKWIKANYYDQGCTSLQAMIDIGNYASDNIKWINGIVSIMRTSYSII